MPRWEAEGDVLCQHIDWGLKQFDSGSVCVKMMHKVLYAWNGKEWIDYSEQDYTFYGDYFIVDKGGNPLEGTVSSLVNALGWDGQLASLNKGTDWTPADCRVVVKGEIYKEKTYYKGAFLNPYNSSPGGSGVGTRTETSPLEQRYGATFRALAKKAAPPKGTAPPPPPATPEPLADEPEPDDSDIPF